MPIAPGRTFPLRKSVPLYGRQVELIDLLRKKREQSFAAMAEEALADYGHHIGEPWPSALASRGKPVFRSETRVPEDQSPYYGVRFSLPLTLAQWTWFDRVFQRHFDAKTQSHTDLVNQAFTLWIPRAVPRLEWPDALAERSAQGRRRAATASESQPLFPGGVLA